MRIAIAVALVLVGIGLMLLPSPLVSEAGLGMSGLAEWHMHRKIARAVDDGQPCVAIAVGYSEDAAEQVIDDELESWTRECAELGAQNQTPIVIRVSHKSGGVRIDVEGAREAGLEVEPEKVRAARDAAWEEIGIEHYEATAWLALTGIVDDEPAAIPWYMAARGRSLRSTLRSFDILLMILLVVLAVMFAATKPGTFRDRPWFNGSVSSSSIPSAMGGVSSPPPSSGSSTSFAEDDE